MKGKVKIILGQTMLVSFLVVAEMALQGIFGHASGAEYSFEWYMPASVIVISFLSSVPTLLLYIGTSSRLKLIALVAVHYLLVMAIVLVGGYFVRWYSGVEGFLIVFAACTIIYVIVWVVTTLMFRHDAKAINTALGDVRDEE